MSDVVKYEPKKPVQSTKTLKYLLEKNEDNFSALLPESVTPKRFIRTVILGASKNPDILSCTQESIILSASKAAELGLEIGREAHLVPFGNSCEMMPDYKGLVKLARNSGEVVRVDADVVYENDHFIYEKGSEPRLEFRPLITGDRGRPVGAYALAQLRNGEVETGFVPIDEIEGIRSQSRSKNSPAWKNYYDEMAKKVAFKRLAKWLPISSEKFFAGLELSNKEFDMDTPKRPLRGEYDDVNAALGLIDPQDEAHDATWEEVDDDAAPFLKD